MFQIRNFLLVVCIICSNAVYCQAHPDDEDPEVKLLQYNKQKALSGSYKLTASDTIKVDILSEIVKLNYERDTKKALKHVSEQLKIAEATNYAWGVADAYENYGNIYDFLRNYDVALKYYLKALARYKANRDHYHTIDIHNNLGILYIKKGFYTSAQRHLLASLNLAKKVNDPQGLIGYFNNIGLIYKEQNKLDQAIKYYNECIKLQLKDPVKYQISYTYLNIAEIYRLKGNYKKAIEIATLGLNEALADKDSLSTANNFSLLGNIYMDLNRFDDALKNHEKAFKIRKQFNDGYGLFKSYIAYSAICSKTGKIKDAIAYANKASELVESNGELTFLADVNRQLSIVYKQAGDYKAAYNYHVQYKLYSDSIFNLSNERNLTEQRLKFEFKEVEAKNKAKAEAVLASQRRMRIVLLLGLATFFIAIIVYIMRSYNRKNRKNKVAYTHGIALLHDEISIMESETETLKIENENIQLRAHLVAAEKEQEREKLQEKLDYNKRELASTALYLFQKNQILSELQTELEELKDEPNAVDKYKKIKSKIQQNLYLDADWDRFKLHFEQVHPDFFKELNKTHPTLTAYEVRLYAYLHMKLSTKEIAGLLNITPASVIKAKVRLNKKLNNKQDTTDQVTD